MTTISARARLQHHRAGAILLQVSASGTPTVESFTTSPACHVVELRDLYEGRHLVLDAPAGLIEIAYDATVDVVEPAPDLGELDRLQCLRPSRYCPSDLLWDPPVQRIEDVEPWVFGHLSYELGSSRPTEDALQTMQRGSGVCRDFAHVVVTICRALQVPARVFSCYAPGLEPQDFHLVAEVWIDGVWQTVDATRLTDPSTLVRICTGRDAVDTAWMTTYGPDAWLELVDVQVT